jgi:hypothetical protein
MRESHALCVKITLRPTTQKHYGQNGYAEAQGSFRVNGAGTNRVSIGPEEAGLPNALPALEAKCMVLQGSGWVEVEKPGACGRGKTGKMELRRETAD